MFEELQTLAEIEWNPREVLRVTLNECKSHPYLSLRVWYRQGGELRPGKQGLAVPLRLLREFHKAMEKAALGNMSL